MNPTNNTAPGDKAPEHPVFDANVLGALFDHEPALITSVLQTFVVGTRSNLAELAQALAAKDLAAVAALAHKTAGASRMSGAIALGHCAHSVEQAAKQGNVAAVQQGFADLESQWRLVQTAIAAQPT